MRFFVIFALAFPFLMTTLGSAAVFLLRCRRDGRAQRMCLGFAAGVMAAASVFSLLLPAIAQAQTLGLPPTVVVTAGFLLGALLMIAADAIAPDGQSDMLLTAAVTLHNIPEGMAVGLAAATALSGNMSAAAAVSTALGIGLQNLPEGAAIALPLHMGGMPRGRSFLCGVLSGVVEPAAAAAMLLLAARLSSALPGLMAFAAGAMVFVAFGELIPRAAICRDGLIAAMLGFALMMAMDMGLS